MRIALDTNFLVCAEGINDPVRRDLARGIAPRLPAGETFVPVQVLGELFRVLTGKGGYDTATARATILNLRDIHFSLETTQQSLHAAMDLACDHQLSIWDAIIICVAADAGCRLLLSEDMHDGFVWRGLTIVNPFAAKRNPLLEAALS
ncbi:MAG: PIN domain-containing protein [Proteobacteria bacterium]|nr:PIN domain-containing protein [Pseudomonadota bacterium]